MGIKYEGGRYVKDSTKGSAKVNPKRYKKDALVQAWIDRRDLATLVTWLDQEGTPPRNIADILRVTIESVIDSLVNNEVVKKVEFTGDAERIMGRFNANLNPRGKGKRNLHHNLVLDHRRMEEGDQSNDPDVEFARMQMERYRKMENEGGFNHLKGPGKKLENEEDMIFDDKGIYRGRKSQFKNKIDLDKPSESPVDVEKQMGMARENDRKIENM